MPAGRLRTVLSGISLTRALVGLGVLLVTINVSSAIWDIRSDRQRVLQRERAGQRTPAEEARERPPSTNAFRPQGAVLPAENQDASHHPLLAPQLR